MSRPTAPASATRPAPPGSGWHRPMLLCTAVMAVFAVVSTVGLLVDDRVLVGSPIWLKPLKFALSIGIYALTWAWLFSLLRRRRRLAHGVSTVIVGVVLVEYAVIVTQVVRGTTSHFNVSTPLNLALWALMGTSIVVLWVGTLVLTVLLLRTPIADTATRWSIRLGTVLSLIGLALGGLMLGPTPDQRAERQAGAGGDVLGAHSVGVADGGPGMPLTGWSTTGGDLRIPHFIGMHALQVLPLLALGLGVWARRWPRLADPVVRSRIVLVSGGVYAGLVALVTWQALRGQPLIDPDTATLVSFAALVAGGAAGLVWSLRGGAAALGSPASGATASTESGTTAEVGADTVEPTPETHEPVAGPR